MSLTITRKVTVSGGTVLRAANNLGDVASASASRGNLGFATTTTDNAVVRFDGVAGQTQNSGVTIDDSGNLSSSGVSGSIGQATISNRYIDVGSTTDGQTVGYNLGVFDGANNYRSSFFLDDANGISGINVNRSSGSPQVQLQLAGVPRFIGTTTGSAVFGTTTNDNAATGYVGEYVSSTVSGVSLSNGAVANVTSIVLTAGDWDVTAQVGYDMSGATVTELIAGTSLSSAGYPDGFNFPISLSGRTGTYSFPVAHVRRVSVSGSTTVYMTARADFSAGTITAQGTLQARRVR